MLDIADLEFFKVVSECQSLAAAARELRVSAPAVSQRVSLLERRIGLPLFERKDQKSKLTDAGNLLASRGRMILSTMHGLMTELEYKRGAYPTPLRVLVPMGSAGWFMSQQALSFMRKHPNIKLQLTRSDELPQKPLKSDNWDIMIYHGNTVDDTHSERLEQIKICSMRLWLVASPAYIAEHGTPLTPEALQCHSLATRQANSEDGLGTPYQPQIAWELENADGKIVHVKATAQYSSNDFQLLHDWCACGMGIIARPEVSVVDDVMAGTLVRILPDWNMPNMDVIAICRKQSLYINESKGFVEDLKAVVQNQELQGIDSYAYDKLMYIYQ